jgi:hypothetical protein
MGENGLTGGCQCGAVRYRLETAPTHTNICHCRMCQKATGSPYGAFAAVPTDKLTFTRGAPKVYRSSTIAKRGFCAECGTPLTYSGVNSPRVSVTICSLDDPNAVAPSEQLDADFAVAWISDCLTKPNTQIANWLKSKQIADVGSRQHPDHD